MKFDIIVPTKDLIHAVNLAGSIVEKRTPLPILGHLKLDAGNGVLVMTATDMDLSIRLEIGVQVNEAGSLAVPAQTFSEIIKKIPDSEISLKFIEQSSQIEIISKNGNFTLSTLPASDFPLMEDIGTSNHINLPISSLAQLLDHTKFAMSTEETRYNLNGIYLHAIASEPRRLYAAATDGHRLSVSSTILSTDLVDFGIILPRKSIQELLKIIKNPEHASENIDLYLGQNRVKFSCGKVMMISKLIDGSFPEYQAFIPVNNQNSLTIHAKTLAEIIDRVATITIDKFRAVKITCNTKGVEVHASGETRGVAHEVVASSSSETGPTYLGAEVAIGFNPRYLLDALNAVSGSMVRIELQDPFSPALIKVDDYPDSYFVVMPVKV